MLVPNIYGRAAHLHPVLVVVALLIGAETFGFIGAVVAVPLAAALQVGVEELYIKDVVATAERDRWWRGWRWSLLAQARRAHMRRPSVRVRSPHD